MTRQLFAALAVLAAGCGAQPSAPTAPPPTINALQIGADQKLLEVGSDLKLKAIATMTDGTTLNLTNDVKWATSNNSILDITADGVVTAVSAGDATITLTWNALSATTTLRNQQTRSGVFVRGRVREYVAGVPVAGLELRYGNVAQATTDSNGSYSLWLPTPGEYDVSAAQRIHTVVVTPSGFRGDLLTDSGTCIARYGRIVDSASGQPIAGASVSMYGGLTAITDSDGAYRFDRGCPASGIEGFNTNILSAAKPGYATNGRVMGRGLYFVVRIDLALSRQ